MKIWIGNKMDYYSHKINNTGKIKMRKIWPLENTSYNSTINDKYYELFVLN